MALRWAFTRVGAFVDTTGKADGVPSIDPLRRFVHPRLVGTGANSISVVWGVVDSVGDKGSTDANRVVLSSFDGREWSKPTTIISAKRLQLNSPAVAVRAGAKVEATAFAAVATDSGPSFIRLAYRTPDGWRQIDWRSPSRLLTRRATWPLPSRWSSRSSAMPGRA